MSRRKELNKDNYNANTEIEEGDEQHPVWQAAFGSAFAMNAEHMTGSSDSPVRLYRVATSTADMAYAMYKESVGVHKRTTKQPNGKKTNDASFSMGNHIVMGESSKAIMIETPEEWLEEFDGKEQAWIPKSQIHTDSQVGSDGEEGELLVTEWWAKKRGIYGGEEKIEDDRVPF